MPTIVRLAHEAQILPLRTLRRLEMNCQIVHDSIHRRPGWTEGYLIELDGRPVGFGSVAVSGPWTGRRTVFEFYVVPELRARAFAFFELFTEVSKPQNFEIQSNDTTAFVLAVAFGREIRSEKIVFQDGLRTDLICAGSRLKQITSRSEIEEAIQRRQGGGEWVLEHEGHAVAKGGILFHYNPPYGDIFMEVEEGRRGCGFGSFLVQELKRVCYELGAAPAARCNPDNIASRRTLARAGFRPFAHILIGKVND